MAEHPSKKAKITDDSHSKKGRDTAKTQKETNGNARKFLEHLNKLACGNYKDFIAQEKGVFKGKEKILKTEMLFSHWCYKIKQYNKLLREFIRTHNFDKENNRCYINTETIANDIDFYFNSIIQSFTKLKAVCRPNANQQRSIYYKVYNQTPINQSVVIYNQNEQQRMNVSNMLQNNILYNFPQNKIVEFISSMTHLNGFLGFCLELVLVRNASFEKGLINLTIFNKANKILSEIHNNPEIIDKFFELKELFTVYKNDSIDSRVKDYSNRVVEEVSDIENSNSVEELSDIEKTNESLEEETNPFASPYSLEKFCSAV